MGRRAACLPWMALVLVAAACTGKDPYRPGTALGTYDVTATRLSNSCGDGAVPDDPWLFDVRLAREHSTVYWVQGGAPVAGRLESSGRVSWTTSDSREVRAADPRRGVGACALERADEVTATLGGPGAAAAAADDARVDGFEGTLLYRFVPTDGSDCTREIGAAGFAALPCEIRFKIEGKQRGAS